MILHRHGRNLLRLLMALTITCSGGIAALAQTLDYSLGFFNTSGLTANQNYGYGAIFANNRLRLTDGGGGQAGSVFATERVNISRFTTTFTFQLRRNTNPMADGITFTIQGVGPRALGPSGGGLGYGPDFIGMGGIPNSVAIKFDTYSNAGEGINSTGLYLNGEGPILPSIDLNGTGIDLHSERVFRVDMRYDGFTLDVTITDLTSGAAYTQFYNIDIGSYIGSDLAWVGFTGGTGGLTATQEILTWRYSSGETVLGNIDLMGSVNLAQGITFAFRPNTGGGEIVRSAILTPTGEFTFFDIPAGSYEVAIKGDRWLRSVVPLTVSAGGINVVEALLIPGDLNDDNIIDLFDLIDFFSAYGSAPGDPNWNPAADVNCDGSVVDLFDLILFFANYGSEGDP
jgi:hypothetical protein